MSAVEDLTEVATRAARAEAAGRSAKWNDREALAKSASRLTEGLREDRELLRRPPAIAVGTSAVWARRTEALVADAEPPDLAAPVTDAATLDRIAADREADAVAAVNAARIALTQAHLAVLQARLAAIDAGDSEATAATIRGYQRLAKENPIAGHGHALAAGTRDELVHIVRDKPRDIAFRLTVSLGFGLGYLLFLRVFLWDTTQHELPFLALFAFSGLAGSAVCTNALSVDAARVRSLLAGGGRLWHIIVTKNLALGCIVFVLGTTLNLLLFGRTETSTTFIKATGFLITMMLLWFGVGNVLAVISPLRAVPLPDRRHDGTLIPFLFSFVVSYGIGYLVNLMLYWRVWAKETLLERFGSPWIPTLLIVVSALLTYALLTVLAVMLADQPRSRRLLTREMIDYRAAKATAAETPTADR